MVKNYASSHKIKKKIWFLISKDIKIALLVSIRVTAILLNGWIFPINQSGEASLWRVFYQRGLTHLVSFKILYRKLYFCECYYFTCWRGWYFQMNWYRLCAVLCISFLCKTMRYSLVLKLGHLWLQAICCSHTKYLGQTLSLGDEHPFFWQTSI